MPNNRKPTAIKRAQGTVQPCRMNPNEPELPVELPEPPANLSARVREEYYRHAELALALGVLTRVEQAALVGVAQACVDWREACEVIDANGSQFIETESGPRAHPAVAVRNEADRRYRQWLKDFGFNPVDRTKVHAQPKEKKSELAQIFEMPA